MAIAQVTVKSHQATQVSDVSMESVGMSDFQNHCFTRGTEHRSRRSCVYTHYVAPPGRNRKLSSCFSNQFLPLSPTHGTAPWGSTGCTGLHNCLHMMITVYVSSVMFFLVISLYPSTSSVMWNWVANLFSINVSQTAPRHDAGAKPSQSQVAFLKFPTASTDSAMDPAIGRGPDCRTGRDSSRSALPMPRTDFRADQHSLVKFLVDQLPPPSTT